MNWKSLIALAALLALLTTEIGRPTPAYASDAGEIAAITIGAIAAYVGVVLFFTYVVLANDFTDTPAPDGGYGAQPPAAATSAGGVHFRCPPDGERFSLVCW